MTPLPNASGEFGGRVRPYYVRVQPEATGLTAVNDDGENTYIEFSILPPGDLKFFDAEGRPLASVWVRHIAALAGVHKGILVRLGTATSYVSQHPQSDQMRKSPLPETPVIAELRDRLLQDAPRAAMSRALERAGRSELEDVRGTARGGTLGEVSGTGSGAVPRATSGNAETRMSSTRSQSGAIVVSTEPTRTGGELQVAESRRAREDMERTIERVQPSIERAQPSVAGSTAIANLTGESAEAPWPRTQRVFFATNSVSISAPDDGLHRLIADARQADEIWIAGHTDSTGPRAVNVWLAKRRAEAIRYILTSRGVEPERIVIVRAPVDTYIASNETDVGRSQNRRVEVTFVRSRGAAAAPRALLEPVAPGVAASRSP